MVMRYVKKRKGTFVQVNIILDTVADSMNPMVSEFSGKPCAIPLMQSYFISFFPDKSGTFQTKQID
jgi:hypothetical protein